MQRRMVSMFKRVVSSQFMLMAVCCAALLMSSGYAQAFNISGRVTDNAGQGVANVKIESTGSVNDGVRTDAQGNYTLTGAAAGTYVITPELDSDDDDDDDSRSTRHGGDDDGDDDDDDGTFSPATRTVTVTNSNVTGVNFILISRGSNPGTGAFTISGRVTNSAGAGVANVRVESTGSVNDGVLTNAQGNYTLTGAAAGTYIITPEIDGVDEQFTPSTRTVTVTNANVSGVNFTLVRGGGSPGTGAFTISGRITNSAGAGVPNVRVESTGSVNDNVLTNAQGFYTLTGAAAGTYTITAEIDGADEVFNPTSRTVTVTNSNVTGVNFTLVRGGGNPGTGTFTISGRVTNSAGVGVANVRIESTGTLADNILTNAQGFYTLRGAAAGTYIITPEIDGVDETFSPATRTVTVTNRNVTGVNFTLTSGGNPGTGTFTISGRVTNAAGQGIAGVKIESTGSVDDDSVRTDAQGNYTLTGAAAGTYIITPERDDIRFAPRNRTVRVTSANVTNVNFTATRLFNIIVRVVSSAGVPIPDVRITSTGNVGAVVTNPGGIAVLRGVAPGTYTLAATRTGMQFTPSSQVVTIVDRNVAVRFLGANQTTTP